MRPKKLLLVSVLLLAGLAVGGGYGPWLLIQARATENWTATEGVIVDSQMVALTGRNRTYPYEVRVRYSYETDGDAHEGDRWSVHGSRKATSHAQAAAFLSELAAGSEVEVFVDPDEPRSAVLERGGGGRAWATIGFGLAMLLGGVFIGLRSLRAG